MPSGRAGAGEAPRLYKKFEDVKDDVKRKLMRERANEALDSALSAFAAALEAETRRAADEGRGASTIEFETLKRLALQCGLIAVHAGLIDEKKAERLEGVEGTRAIADLFTSGRVGQWSGVIALDEGRKIMVCLLNRRRRESIALEQVKERVRLLYVKKEAADASKKAAYEFISLAKKEGLDAAMLKKGVEVVKTDFLRRGGLGGALDAIRGADSKSVLNHVFSVEGAGSWTGALERMQETPREFEDDRDDEYLREKKHYVAQCLDIELPDPKGFAELVPFLQSRLANGLRYHFYSTWRDDAKKRANLTYLNQKPESKRRTNETEARSRLERIVEAEKTFSMSFNRYATIEELSDPNRLWYGRVGIDQSDVGERDGYVITVTLTDQGGFKAVAEPVKGGLSGTGNRRYFADDSFSAPESETIEQGGDE